MLYPTQMLSRFPFEAYVVGGAVRDFVMQRPNNDIDIVVVGQTPEAMVALGGREVSKSFPIYLFDGLGVEFALARLERNSPVQDYTAVTLTQDLSRRDLTINSMAMGADGCLIDLFGGVRDINARVLRHVGPHFADDPDRIFRVARFAAQLDYSVAPETMALMRELVDRDLVAIINPERLTKEFQKALLAPYPRRFFEVLDECGALAKWLPELSSMHGIPQRVDFHAEGDVWVHTLFVLDEAVILSRDLPDESKLRVRTAALFHDIGKTRTPHKHLWDAEGNMLGKHPGHESEWLLKEMFDSLAPRLVGFSTDYTAFARLIGEIHQKVHRCHEMGEKSWVRLYVQCGEKRFLNRDRMLEDVALACEADHRGRLVLENSVPVQPTSYPNGDLFKRMMNEIISVPEGAIMKEQISQKRSVAKAKQVLLRARIRHLASTGMCRKASASEALEMPGF